MYLCMYACMYVCMYVCMHIHILIHAIWLRHLLGISDGSQQINQQSDASLTATMFVKHRAGLIEPLLLSSSSAMCRHDLHYSDQPQMLQDAENVYEFHGKLGSLSF